MTYKEYGISEEILEVKKCIYELINSYIDEVIVFSKNRVEGYDYDYGTDTLLPNEVHLNLDGLRDPEVSFETIAEIYYRNRISNTLLIVELDIQADIYNNRITETYYSFYDKDYSITRQRFPYYQFADIVKKYTVRYGVPKPHENHLTDEAVQDWRTFSKEFCEKYDIRLDNTTLENILPNLLAENLFKGVVKHYENDGE